MIAAEEFHKLADFLRQKRANVNGSLDKAEKSADKKLTRAKSFAKCTLSLHFFVLLC